MKAKPNHLLITSSLASAALAFAIPWRFRLTADLSRALDVGNALSAFSIVLVLYGMSISSKANKWVLLALFRVANIGIFPLVCLSDRQGLHLAAIPPSLFIRGHPRLRLFLRRPQYLDEFRIPQL